jgi:NADPH:quinone reductase-like Zn-dependent oxidoreductase
MTKAVIINAFGEPDQQVSVGEVLLAPPAAGQVLVRLLAAPVNPSDLMTIRGVYTKIPKLPFTPGYEGVGIVEKAGPGLLGSLLVGKRVAFLSGDGGTWAEQALLPARQVVPISKDVPDEQAASFFVNPVTAYALVRKILKVPAGQSLVISAAGSTLGRMVIRLGKKLGLRPIAWVRRHEVADELAQLGASEVIVGEPDNFESTISSLTRGEGIKYAIDCVGGETGSAIIRSLGPKGRLIVYGTMSGQPLQFSSRVLMGKGSSVEGFWLGNFMNSLSLFEKISLVRTVGKLIKEGVLASEGGKCFPLAEVANAIREAERPGRQGKVLLQITSG